jgi:hypothetical protein
MSRQRRRDIGRPAEARGGNARPLEKRQGAGHPGSNETAGISGGPPGRGKVGYTADEIDVLVAHIIPKSTWYVLPIEDFAPARSLRFYPDIECKRAKWEGYREAWGLMRK